MYSDLFMHDGSIDPLDRDLSPIHRTYFDPESTDRDQLPQTIVRSISTVADRPAAELAPLYETIDVEALERLLEHSATAGSGIDVTFSVNGWGLRATGDGEVLVYEGAEESDGVVADRR